MNRRTLLVRLMAMIGAAFAGLAFKKPEKPIISCVSTRHLCLADIEYDPVMAMKEISKDIAAAINLIHFQCEKGGWKPYDFEVCYSNARDRIGFFQISARIK